MPSLQAGQRIAVEADIAGERLAGAAKQLRNALTELERPAGYVFDFGGRAAIETPAFWNILSKDMRTCYPKPPNVSWGLIFPPTWTAIFFIMSGGGLGSIVSLLPERKRLL